MPITPHFVLLESASYPSVVVVVVVQCLIINLDLSENPSPDTKNMSNEEVDSNRLPLTVNCTALRLCYHNVSTVYLIRLLTCCNLG